jgi:hypothetical protein
MDFDFFPTETVVVETREQTGADELNAPVYKNGELNVPGVLVEPGETDDVRDSVRDGDVVRYTLRFPKAYSGPRLEGLRIRVRGESLAVIGAPRPFDPEACPTDYNMTVRVGDAHG